MESRAWNFMRSSMSTYMRWPRWVERGVWWQILLVLKRLKAGAQRMA